MGQQSGKRLSRKERERREHRRLILEAAEELFARKGFHATSVQEIADEAEFSVGSLYNLFESKERLYHELIEMRADQYLRKLDQRLDEADGPVDKVRAAVRCKLDFFEEHRQFFHIFGNFVSGAESASPPMLSKRCLEIHGRIHRQLESVFEAGIREGIFADIDPVLAVLVLEGTTNAIIGEWIHTGSRKLESMNPGAVERILFHGLLDGKAK